MGLNSSMDNDEMAAHLAAASIVVLCLDSEQGVYSLAVAGGSERVVS